MAGKVVTTAAPTKQETAGARSYVGSAAKQFQGSAKAQEKVGGDARNVNYYRGSAAYSVTHPGSKYNHYEQNQHMDAVRGAVERDQEIGQLNEAYDYLNSDKTNRESTTQWIDMANERAQNAKDEDIRGEWMKLANNFNGALFSDNRTQYEEASKELSKLTEEETTLNGNRAGLLRSASIGLGDANTRADYEKTIGDLAANKARQKELSALLTQLDDELFTVLAPQEVKDARALLESGKVSGTGFSSNNTRDNIMEAIGKTDQGVEAQRIVDEWMQSYGMNQAYFNGIDRAVGAARSADYSIRGGLEGAGSLIGKALNSADWEGAGGSVGVKSEQQIAAEKQLKADEKLRIGLPEGQATEDYLAWYNSESAKFNDPQYAFDHSLDAFQQENVQRLEALLNPEIEALGKRISYLETRIENNSKASDIGANSETLRQAQEDAKTVRELRKQQQDLEDRLLDAQGLKDKTSLRYKLTTDYQNDIFAKMDAHVDTLDAKSQAEILKAKERATSYGKILLDMEKTGLEMGFDMAAGMLTGGSSLVPMFLRVMGNESAAARRDGATLDQQLKYGVTKAAIELATEKLFGAFDKIGYGKGVLNTEFAERIVKRLAETPLGRTVVRAIISAVEEGAEEGLADILGPIADQMYKDETWKESWDNNTANFWYDVLLGAAMGGLGIAGGVVTGQNARANYELYQSELSQDREAIEAIEQERKDRIANTQKVRGEDFNPAKINEMMDAKVAEASQNQSSITQAYNRYKNLQKNYPDGNIPINEKLTRKEANMLVAAGLLDRRTINNVALPVGQERMTEKELSEAEQIKTKGQEGYVERHNAQETHKNAVEGLKPQDQAAAEEEKAGLENKVVEDAKALYNKVAGEEPSTPVDRSGKIEEEEDPRDKRIRELEEENRQLKEGQNKVPETQPSPDGGASTSEEKKLVKPASTASKQGAGEKLPSADAADDERIKRNDKLRESIRAEVKAATKGDVLSYKTANGETISWDKKSKAITVKNADGNVISFTDVDGKPAPKRLNDKQFTSWVYKQLAEQREMPHPEKQAPAAKTEAPVPEVEAVVSPELKESVRKSVNGVKSAAELSKMFLTADEATQDALAELYTEVTGYEWDNYPQDNMEELYDALHPSEEAEAEEEAEPEEPPVQQEQEPEATPEQPKESVKKEEPKPAPKPKNSKGNNKARANTLKTELSAKYGRGSKFRIVYDENESGKTNVYFDNRLITSVDNSGFDQDGTVKADDVYEAFLENERATMPRINADKLASGTVSWAEVKEASNNKVWLSEIYEPFIEKYASDAAKANTKYKDRMFKSAVAGAAKEKAQTIFSDALKEDADQSPTSEEALLNYILSGNSLSGAEILALIDRGQPSPLVKNFVDLINESNAKAIEAGMEDALEVDDFVAGIYNAILETEFKLHDSKNPDLLGELNKNKDITNTLRRKIYDVGGYHLQNHLKERAGENGNSKQLATRRSVRQKRRSKRRDRSLQSRLGEVKKKLTEATAKGDIAQSESNAEYEGFEKAATELVDDGYVALTEDELSDTYKEALGILAEYGIQASVFDGETGKTNGVSAFVRLAQNIYSMFLKTHRPTETINGKPALYCKDGTSFEHECGHAFGNLFKKEHGNRPNYQKAAAESITSAANALQIDAGDLTEAMLDIQTQITGKKLIKDIVGKGKVRDDLLKQYSSLHTTEARIAWLKKNVQNRTDKDFMPEIYEEMMMEFASLGKAYVAEFTRQNYSLDVLKALQGAAQSILEADCGVPSGFYDRIAPVVNKLNAENDAWLAEYEKAQAAKAKKAEKPVTYKKAEAPAPASVPAPAHVAEPAKPAETKPVEAKPAVQKDVERLLNHPKAKADRIIDFFFNPAGQFIQNAVKTENERNEKTDIPPVTAAEVTMDYVNAFNAATGSNVTPAMSQEELLDVVQKAIDSRKNGGSVAASTEDVEIDLSKFGSFGSFLQDNGSKYNFELKPIRDVNKTRQMTEGEKKAAGQTQHQSVSDAELNRSAIQLADDFLSDDNPDHDIFSATEYFLNGMDPKRLTDEEQQIAAYLWGRLKNEVRFRENYPGYVRDAQMPKNFDVLHDLAIGMGNVVDISMSQAGSKLTRAMVSSEELRIMDAGAKKYIGDELPTEVDPNSIGAKMYRVLDENIEREKAIHQNVREAELALFKLQSNKDASAEDITKAKEAIKKAKAQGAKDMLKLMREVNITRNATKVFGEKGGKFMDGILDKCIDRIMNNSSEAYDIIRKLTLGSINRIIYDFDVVGRVNTIKQIRYLNMLSNFATIANNVLNNLESASTGAAAQNIAVRLVGKKAKELNGGEDVLTRNDNALYYRILPGKNKELKDYVRTKAAESVLQLAYGLDYEEGKYETGIGRARHNQNDNTAGKILGTFQFLSGLGMSTTDTVAIARAYKGMEMEIDKMKVSDARKAELKKDALEEARRQMYHSDQGKLVKSMESLRDWMNNIKLAEDENGSIGVGDIVMPFVAVPVNVASRALRATPAGQLVGLLQFARNMKRFEKQSAKFKRFSELQAKIDAKTELSSAEQAEYDSLKGAKAPNEADIRKTMRIFGESIANAQMTVLAAAATFLGALRNFDDEDDEEAKRLAKEKGYTGLQFNLSALVRGGEWRDEGDLIVGGGWLEVLALPFAAGATIAKSVMDRDEGTSAAHAMVEAVLNSPIATLDDLIKVVQEVPGIDQAMDIWNAYDSLSNSDNFTEDFRKQIGSSLSQYLTNTATSFVIPNAWSQLGAGFDNTVRDVYNADSNLEVAKRMVMNKTVFFRHMLPEAKTSMGETRKYGPNKLAGLANRMIIPGTGIQVYSRSELEKEYADLRAAGKKEGKTWDVAAKASAPKYIEVDDVKYNLSSEEKAKYDEDYTNKVVAWQNELMKTPGYQAMNAEQRKEAMADVRTLAALTEKNDCLELKKNKGEVPADVTVDFKSWEQAYQNDSAGLSKFLVGKYTLKQFYGKNKDGQYEISDYKAMDNYLDNDYSKLDEIARGLLDASYPSIDKMYDARKATGMSMQTYDKLYDLWKQYDDRAHNDRADDETYSSLNRDLIVKFYENASEKDAAWAAENMRIWMTIPANIDTPTKIVNKTSLDWSKADRWLDTKSRATPLGGHKALTKNQIYMMIRDSDFTEQEKWELLELEATDSAWGNLSKFKAQGKTVAYALSNANWWRPTRYTNWKKMRYDVIYDEDYGEVE